LAAAGLPADSIVDCRRIGTDDAMVETIIERIATGEKTMTYSLPWLAEREGKGAPAPGDLIAVLDARGAPRLLLRLRRVQRLRFGEVSVDDIAEEGLPMRDIDAWRPLHFAVWNEKLAPHGLEVSDDMPVRAEYFELLADAGSAC
ncbi:MAG: ASCH domain-containing protein, partial [Gammaproteobacteria bacterium]